MRILHLSDTHLTGDNRWHYGVVDTAAALDRVLSHASHIDNIDAVVCSGDLSDDGTPASYRTLRAAVDPWAAERGASVIYAMGNHDVHAGFVETLGDTTGMTCFQGFRIARLDSAVPGHGYGTVDPTQLRWLREELAVSRVPTVVVLHHPPTPAVSPLLAALELQNPEELLDICCDSSVVAILAGHYHHALATTERGIPVFVAPGITNCTDAHAPDGHERATVGSGYAVIDIPIRDDGTAGAPRATFHAAPSADDGREIFDLGPEEVASIAAKAGPPRHR